MNLAQILFATLFCAKIGWNLCIPYALAIRARRGGRSGTSLMPYLEWASLGLYVAAATISGGAAWYEDPTMVALLGSGVILASYVHFFLAGAMLWLFERLAGAGEANR